jgi:hypothetical protein
MAQTFYTTAKNWVDIQTSLGGVVTFSPTDGAGIALFSSIFAVQFTAESNTGIFSSMPLVALKAISGDLKTVTANVGTGTVLGILGATIIAAPDGTRVHAHLIGV